MPAISRAGSAAHEDISMMPSPSPAIRRSMMPLADPLVGGVDAVDDL
jgi:hypothetical protein